MPAVPVHNVSGAAVPIIGNSHRSITARSWPRRTLQPRPALALRSTGLTETIKGQNPDGSLNAGQTFTSTVINGNTAVDHNALAAFAHAHDGFFLA